MSKFIDRINLVSDSRSSPIGFKKRSSDSIIPSILLILDISNLIGTKSKEDINIEADAVVLNISAIDVATISWFAKTINAVPVGIKLGKENKQNIGIFEANGIDFVIFDLATQIDGLDHEGLGKILKINRSLPTGMIKAIKDLSINIDCVMVDNTKNEIDIELLLQCHAFTNIVNIPLIISVANSPSISEMIELSNANIRALILPPGTSSEKIKQLKDDIASLPKASKKKMTHRPLIPPIPIISKEEEIEEDDE